MMFIGTFKVKGKKKRKTSNLNSSYRIKLFGIKI
jgi:hypothetical protein